MRWHSVPSRSKYVANDWLERLGSGVFKRPNEILVWTGALYILQKQLCLQFDVRRPGVCNAGSTTWTKGYLVVLMTAASAQARVCK
ncbi:hypothetical protein MMA231_01256 [Asticcacaulis sp. MM231]